MHNAGKFMVQHYVMPFMCGPLTSVAFSTEAWVNYFLNGQEFN